MQKVIFFLKTKSYITRRKQKNKVEYFQNTYFIRNSFIHQVIQKEYIGGIRLEIR